jgi:hypothetical protein
VGGYRYLEFDGVDDYLRSTFTITQPIDRISAIQQVTWTANDHIFGGATASGGVLYQAVGTPALYVFSGANGPSSSGLALSVNGIVTERHDDAASRLAINSGAYTIADANVNVGGGITLGATHAPGNWGNFYLYQMVMRGSTTAFTDAQVSACRALCAIKSGVTL